MTSNTAHLIPYHAVSAILVKDEYQNFAFSGTGFFVKFLPYDDIFFVTAKHCVPTESQVNNIYVHANPESEDNSPVTFSQFFLVKESEEASEFEDVIVYLVDKKDKNFETIKDRALRLIHQEDVDLLLSTAEKNVNYKLRTVGFPATDEKEIDYDTNTAKYQPRGFYGDSISYEYNMYSMKNLNWVDNHGKFEGFSGSPIIYFLPDTLEPIPLGVILTGSNGIVRFKTINIVTNMIADYNVKVDAKDRFDF